MFLNWKTFAVIAGCLAVLSVLGPFLASHLTRSNYAAIIEDEYDLTPMVPPNNHFGPGFFYVVGWDGNIDRVVCDASGYADRVTYSQTKTVSVSSKFTADSDILGQLSASEEASAAANSIRSIKVIIRDAEVGHLDDAARLEVLGELTQDRFCRLALDKAIADGYCVAQGTHVLRATADVKVITTSGAESDLSAEGSMPSMVEAAVMQSLRANLGTSINTDFQGEKLYFGFRLEDRCIQDPDDAYNRSTPVSKWWHVIAVQNVYSKTYQSFANLLGNGLSNNALAGGNAPNATATMN
ncbi:hypothetical protein E1180_07590 [Roseibium denhamense]|uniref:Uncharacterized protein n=1 Tax=Roseibium denhamense TaxID=76305 RepID=A0ABY1NTY7_9HYPH|nr:hypothetical protein [Roseibium denhamense]MTI05376.1 hypothetical protein [Roseibium denhamense]SMP17470.1 hypothetical protein SAMN06265374_1829 [Roseibium denhamense]